MKSATKFTFILLVLATLLAILLAFSYWLGRHQALQTLQSLSQQIDYFTKSETLGGLLSEPVFVQNLNQRQKEDFYHAYYAGVNIKQQLDTVSWVPQTILTPFVGNAPRPGQQHNASINAYQMRSQHTLIMPKPDDVFRIFFTGGSTAYGSGAPSQDRIIAAYLERLLTQRLKTNKQYRVYTVAMPAWASTHERIMIENRLSELEPDLVISFSGNNDVFWGQAGRNVLWFHTQSDEHFRSLINTVYELTGLPAPANVSTHSEQPIPPDTVAARLYKNVLLSTYALALQGVSYLFILQPTLAVTKKALTDRESDFLPKEKAYYQSCYQLFDRQLSNLMQANFRFLNLSTLFDQQDTAQDIFLDSFHFGDKGNELIANAIADYLETENIVGR